MPYSQKSPEVTLSDYYETDSKVRFIRHGWYVLHTSQIGDGPTMATGPGGSLVMPDLQLFDLVKGRKSRLVDVKAKRGAYVYQKDGVVCTGMDYAEWEDFLRINSTGVPVDLAFIHLHHPLRSSPEIAPKLYWQTVDVLAQRDPMTFPHPRFRGGGIVWDVNDFQLLGDLPNPPQEIIEASDAIKRNLRVWEQPPKLRRPRTRPDPRQFKMMFPEEDRR
jgi:hypothetical protein